MEGLVLGFDTADPIPSARTLSRAFEVCSFPHLFPPSRYAHDYAVGEKMSVRLYKPCAENERDFLPALAVIAPTQVDSSLLASF